MWVREHTVSRASGWSDGQSRPLAHRRSVSVPAGWVAPNASCPVCGAAVFFYANEYGSRVYFDELGPPWPKHPCTMQHGYTPVTTSGPVVPTAKKGSSGALTSLTDRGRPLVVTRVKPGGGQGTVLHLSSLQPGGRGNTWHSAQDLALTRGQIVFMSAEVISYVDMRTMEPASARLQFGHAPSRLQENHGPSLLQRIVDFIRR